MLKTRIVAASAAAVVALAPGAARADLSDLAAAEATNTSDQLTAAGEAAEAEDPNVTCDVKAGGRDVVQHTNFVVGEIYAEDFGFGQGECVSLDGARRYYVTLHVRLEYFTRTSLTDGYWTPIP